MLTTTVLYAQDQYRDEDHMFKVTDPNYPGLQKITISGKGLKFKDFFGKVYEMTRRQAFYNDEQLSSEEVIPDFDFKDVPLDDILRWLFRKKSLTWYHRAETFVILPVSSKYPLVGELPKPKTAISGMVVDFNGEGIPGVTVIVKDQNIGASTDRSGLFSVVVPGEKATIILSSIGFETKEIVAGKAPIRLQLVPTTSGLDEVVILGYTKTSRRNTTGDIGHVSSKEIGEQPVNNVLEALTGRVNGLEIVTLSGVPGSNYTIRIRGNASISAGTAPLIVVDGVPLASNSISWDFYSADGPNYFAQTALGLGANTSSSPLNVINKADIESIDVLKDADATSIYGSRGANGVIVITTKQGKASSHPEVGVNVYHAIGIVEHQIDYLNTKDYIAMRREAYSNDGMPATDPDVNGSWDSTRNFDWQRQMIGNTAHITDAQASISGGTTQSRYWIGGGYHKETTAFPGDFGYKKGSGRLNFYFASPDGNWRSSLGISLMGDRNYLPTVDLTYYSLTPPNTPQGLNPDGSINFQPGFDNPFAAMARQYRVSTDNLMISSSTSYRLTNWLELKVNMGWNKMTMDEVQTSPKSSFDPAIGATSYSFFGTSYSKNWVIAPQLTADKRFGSAHVSTTIGANFQREDRSQQMLYASGFSDEGKIGLVTAATTIIPMGANLNIYRYNSFYARISFNQEDKYLFNISARRDGSSRFAAGKEYANFWAVGAGWVFTKEDFFKAKSIISFGKIRASYGVTGNDQIRGFNSAKPVPIPIISDGINGDHFPMLANDIHWEIIRKKEIGLDLGFLEDRLLFTASIYHNISSSLLLEEMIPPHLPNAAGILRNTDAKIENKGLELEAKWNVIKKKDLNWMVTVNYSLPQNQLLAMPSNLSPVYNNLYTVNEPINIHKGFQYTGVNPETGLYIFDDANHDGKIDKKDYVTNKVLGTTSYGSVFNRISYKQFELALHIQFVKQTGYDYDFAYVGWGPGIMLNQPQSVMNRWHANGQQANIQRFTQGADRNIAINFDNVRNSDRVITDASYLRIRNISLSWQMPDVWIRTLRLSAGNIYLQAQNFLTITRYPGRSVETATNNSEVLPPLRICAAGLRLSF